MNFDGDRLSEEQDKDGGRIIAILILFFGLPLWITIAEIIYRWIV